MHLSPKLVVAAQPGRRWNIATEKRLETRSVFQLAILGLLADSPMHGYELRQKLSTTIGSLRVFSYGSLYPTLRRLQDDGDITSDPAQIDPDAVPLMSKRSRVIYRLTAEGKEKLAELLGDSGPQASSDDGFEIHLAFFSRTSSEARLRILQSRRRRLETRRDGLSAALSKAAGRMDAYTDQLRQLGLESTDREVRWINELIEKETRIEDPPP
jgi:DNA-binding PadR family transcriptional regulator